MRPTTKLPILLALGCFLLAPAAAASDRILRAEFVLDAPIAQVWDAWTTDEGVRSFFAPGSNIDLRVDGLYEIFFDPEAEPGHRGADGQRILSLEPPTRLSFTWNAPLDQPYVRAQRTVVTVELEPAGARRTRLRFTHSGWGQGDAWDAAFDYFDAAWNRFVLPRLKHRFEVGPLQWEKRPELQPIAASLKRELRPHAAAARTGGATVPPDNASR